MDDLIDLDAARAERPSEVKIKLGGETFRARSAVRPEHLLALGDFPYGDDTSERRLLEVLDETILKYLVQADHGKWKKLREREEDAVAIQDINRFVNALQEAAADRPTVPSSDSSPGTAASEASSTDESSSRVAIQSV